MQGSIWALSRLLGRKEDEEAQRIRGCRLSGGEQTGLGERLGAWGAGQKGPGDREEARVATILPPARRGWRGACGAHSLQKTYSV